MKLKDANKLWQGIYRLNWKSGGGFSLASVGHTHDGTAWFAPTNWTCAGKDKPLIASTKWRMVESVQRLDLK